MSTKHHNISIMNATTSINALISHPHITAAEVFMLGMQALEAAGIKRKNAVKRAQGIIRLGAQEKANLEKSVSIAEAMRNMLENKKERVRPVTMKGLRTLTNRLLRDRPDLANKPIRALTTATCMEWLSGSFSTPRQFINGRAVLSTVCTHAIRRGWADKNPVKGVDIPVIKEQRITALPVHECKLLLNLAETMFKGECLPAVGMLMLAGVRPTELKRLRFKNVCPEEDVISIPPQHSKTGGARHIQLQDPLKNILTNFHGAPECRVIPKDWDRKWRQVRTKFSQLTGRTRQADVQRHTFASYLAKHYGNFPALQMDMGHANATQLRTRYLNMDGIGRNDAETFWLRS